MGIGFATRNIPKLVDPLPGGRHLIDAIEFVVGWSRANSLWPLVYGTACCAMEMMSAGSSRHDWARFGVEVARATPRQADIIILAGTIVEKMGKRLVTLYEQMPGPKYVIAMGSCSISGGPFYYDSYTVVKGGDRLIPVDVYIPGCPPRPEALLYGIMQLQKKIRTEGRRNPWRLGEINTTPAEDVFSAVKKGWAAVEAGRQEELAEARERFKAEHPDYRPPKPKRLPKQPLPEVERQSRPLPGLGNRRLWQLVRQRFPAATLFRQDPAQEAVDEPEETRPLDIVVLPQRYLDLVRFLRDEPRLGCDFLVQLVAVDWQSRFDVLVQLLSVRHGHQLFVRCAVDRAQPELESLSSLFAGAVWHEREIYDLFGIRFRNHPDLRRLFLDEDFPGHPLRKDFSGPGRVVKRPY